MHLNAFLIQVSDCNWYESIVNVFYIQICNRKQSILLQNRYSLPRRDANKQTNTWLNNYFYSRTGGELSLKNWKVLKNVQSS